MLDGGLLGRIGRDAWLESRERVGLTTPPPRARMWPEYANDPLGFFVNVLGDEPWSTERHLRDIPADVLAHLDEPCGQDDLLRAIATHDQVAVVGAKGPGKTWTLGRIPLWFLHTHPNSIVVTIATTATQVATQLWGELETAAEESDHHLGGRLTWAPNPMYKLGPKHLAIALSPKKPESIAGFHSRASKDGLLSGPVLVIADEVSGIPDEILDTLFGLLTNPGSRMIWSLNAKRASGRGYELWHPPMGGALNEDAAGELDDDGEAVRPDEYDDFKLLRITAYDAPKWVISDDWLRKAYRRCSKGGPAHTHPVYLYDVLAEFPKSDALLLFPQPFLEACLANQPKVGGRQLGVDIGRQGSDPCIAILTVDGVPLGVHRWSDRGAVRDLMRSARIIRHLAMGRTWEDPDAEDRGWQVEPQNVHIDGTSGSMGVGVVDRLWEMGMPVDSVDNSAKPHESHMGYWRHVLGPHVPELRNMRQHLHWIGRAALEEGLAKIPAHREFALLWDDLVHIPRKDTPTEEFAVERKTVIADLIGRSPDYSDAWLLTLSRQDAAAVRFRTLGDRDSIQVRKRPATLRDAMRQAGRRARRRMPRG